MEDFTLADVLEQVFLPDEDQDLVNKCRQENLGRGVAIIIAQQKSTHALPHMRSPNTNIITGNYE